ncbi:MAG: hypothetical protein ABSG23_13595 [Terriglobales bacterium]
MKLATKLTSSFSWLLSVLVLLCGCGGGPGTSYSGSPSGSPSGPPAQGQSISSNWQFSTTSTVGMPPLTIAGSISLSGTSLSGAVHVDGSNCFDRLTTVDLTGTLTGSNISLTSASDAGQVATFTGTIPNNALSGTYSPGQLTGTYTINGGCANGDQGNVTGVKILYVANTLSGTFTTSEGGTFDVAGAVAQDSASSHEGSFGVSGTVTFSSPCFSSGTITSGTFPSGSFILGTSVALEIATGNGTIAFVGTLNPDQGEISGDYTVSGGTCDQTGTAVLVTSSPWDY